MTVFRAARRVQSLPPYLFAGVDAKLDELRSSGVDVISFGIGDPDLPTPPHIVEAMREAVLDPSTHRYPSYYGLAELRETIAGWFKGRFGADLDPTREVLPILGSKEGIAHLPWALIDDGDVALMTDPGYPVYDTGTRLAGGVPVLVPCTRANGFVPDLSAIDPQDAGRAKVLWLNFPGNPTAATVDLAFFEEAVEFCRRHEILLAHDAAYSEITYDGYVAPSVLEVPGAKDVAIEFHSLSKTFNMTGWRIGWVCGAPDAIEAIGRLKTNLDSGIFNAIQRAGIAALTGPRDVLERNVQILQSRRDRAIKGLRDAGLDAVPPRGAIYLWVPVPDGESSARFATHVLDGAGVFLTPGAGYGPAGEGFVRLSLTIADDRLDEGLERIRSLLTA